MSSSPSLRHDDIVHAYRWILGREPESAAALEAWLGHEPDALRSALFSSPEFRHAATGRLASAPTKPAALDSSIARFVFLHVPKTAGSTFHDLLCRCFAPDQVCPERFNRIHRYVSADLSVCRLISGHFDAETPRFLPGVDVRVITFLREPTDRLKSLYRFLRGHPTTYVEAENLSLARLARDASFEDFLREAPGINAESVDNTYLRTYGGALSGERWECYAPRTVDIEKDVEALMNRALAFIDSCSGLGITERFDESLRAISRNTGLSFESIYADHQRFEDLAAPGGALEFVPEIEVTRKAASLLRRLTRFDKVLYTRAVARLQAELDRSSALFRSPQCIAQA